MANNVIVQVVGGQKKVLDSINTVGDAREALGLGKNYAGAIGGTNQADSQAVREGDYVTFSEQVKGA